MLGVIYYQKGDPHAAIPFIERALKGNKSMESFHNTLGAVWYRTIYNSAFNRLIPSYLLSIRSICPLSSSFFSLLFLLVLFQVYCDTDILLSCLAHYCILCLSPASASSFISLPSFTCFYPSCLSSPLSLPLSPSRFLSLILFISSFYFSFLS